MRSEDTNIGMGYITNQKYVVLFSSQYFIMTCNILKIHEFQNNSANIRDKYK